MAAINLYAHNQPTVQTLPPNAQASLQTCFQHTQQLQDTSPTHRWAQALQLLADSTTQIHSNHRSYGSAHRLHIRTKPLSYKDAAHRTTCFAHGGLVQAQQDTERANSDLVSDWNHHYRATTGWGGLVTSPTGAASFNSSGARWLAFQDAVNKGGLIPHSAAYDHLYRQHLNMWVAAGGYYESWHCCAVFIANSRIFIYDPHFNSVSSPWNDPTRARRLATDLRSLSMVRHLINWARPQNNHRISIRPDQIYIYRNIDTLQQRNTAYNVPMVAQPGLDCVPLSIQWLVGIAEAWQYDPQEWLECGVDHGNQHGAIPVPRSSTQVALATTTAAQLASADWEKIRL